MLQSADVRNHLEPISMRPQTLSMKLIRSEMEQNKRGTMHSLIATICTITIFFGLSLAASPARAKESVAVVVVDVQGDFTTARNGSLAVPNTDQSYLENVHSR